ncbi:MAG: HNH endonuclease [Aeromicrobium sp.]
MDEAEVVFNVLRAFFPVVPWLIGTAVFWIITCVPMPGRGPGIVRRRDAWRGFKFQARQTVMTRAASRCEGSIFLAWGRCRQVAVEADHIYPWSKGGATIVSNGQALCRDHNRRKSNLTPPWWYVLSLERRRRSYFPQNDDVRVRAGMSPADRAVRAARTSTVRHTGRS